MEESVKRTREEDTQSEMGELCFTTASQLPHNAAPSSLTHMLLLCCAVCGVLISSASLRDCLI